MLLDIPAYHLVQISLLYGIISMPDSLGKQLPSRSQLADIYSTSENTIRKALSALQRQGIIAHGKGHVARVLFDSQNPLHWRRLSKDYPIRQDKIAEITDAYRFVLPPFWLLGLARMKREQINDFLGKIRAILNGPEEEFWPLSCFYLALFLHTSRNNEVVYYYVLTQLSVHCSFRNLSQEEQARVIANRKRMYAWLVQQVQAYLDNGIVPRVGQLFRCVDWYFQQVGSILTQAPLICTQQTVQPLFYDFQQKHLQICLYFAHHIFLGNLRNGVTLPSDCAAANQFGVAVTTARRAYQMLADLGFAQTIARVGTQAIFPPRPVDGVQWSMEETQINACAFLECIEFFRRHIRRVALFTAQRAAKLEESLPTLLPAVKTQTPAYWCVFFLEFTYHIMCGYGNETYSSYYKLMCSMLFFGMSTLAHQVPGCVEEICTICMESVTLLKSGDHSQFAVQFSGAWKKLGICAAEVFADCQQSTISFFPISNPLLEE